MSHETKPKLAKRNNQGKPRYDLLPPEALEEIVKVYTNGAKKYSEFDENGVMTYDAGFNWRLGQKWLDNLASVKRHIAAFERGEDHDPDPTMGNTLHLANAAWGLMALITYYKIHPELDNRQHWYRKPFKRVYCDLDGCIVEFEQYFLKYFDLPDHDSMDWNDHRYKENLDKVKDSEEFWVNCPSLVDPKDMAYPISGYCTARNCSNDIIKAWIRKHNLPDAEIINVGTDGKKSEALKGKCDIMIDDSIKNFVDLNSNGITCYLMTRPHNQKYQVGHLRCSNMKEFFEKVIAQ